MRRCTRRELTDQTRPLSCRIKAAGGLTLSRTGCGNDGENSAKSSHFQRHSHMYIHYSGDINQRDELGWLGNDILSEMIACNGLAIA